MRRLAGLLLFGLCLVLAGDAGLREHAPEPPRQPNDWGWIQRTFPHFRADPGAYRAAFVQAQQLRAAAKASPFGAWRLAGPTNIGGRIVDIAFDPQTPTTVYAAAATGGVFKSTDRGVTWVPIFDDQPVLSIGDLAVAPSDPQRLYVGTGEANGGHNNFAGSGVYTSRDGGRTWQFAGLAETTSIGRVLVHPDDPDRAYVAATGSYFAPNAERGVYRTLDGGQTWERVLFVNDETGAIDLVMRPDDPDVLFAAVWQRVRTYANARLAGPSSGIYRSRDGGQTWQRLGGAHGLPTGPTGRIGLAIAPSAPDVLYALYTDGSDYLGLYRSRDGGQTWTDADPDREVGQGTRGFSWYFGQVRIHPTDPHRVYVLDVMLMDSPDGGQTWRLQPGTHVDHHALAFAPDDPNFAINGNDGGLALSSNAGGLWTRVASLPVTQFYEIAIDPSNPDRLYGGTQDNGTLRTPEGSQDGWSRILGGDGFYVNIDPTNPDVVYAESQNGVLYRLALGEDARSAEPATQGIPGGEPRNWSTPVVMDPHDPQTLYYGTNRLHRTLDGARSWTAISPDLTKRLGTSLLGTLTTIAVAPSDPARLYVGTDDGNVWTTPDGGQTWTDVTAGLPFRWVTRVAVDPFDARTAYVAFSGLKWRDAEPHLFRTTDAGQTWRAISEGLPDAPINALAVDPAYPHVLYVGSDVGAFVSLDTGASWQPLGTGLPAVSVYDLKVYRDDARHFVAAGTHGRSMLVLDVPPLAPVRTGDAPRPLIAELATPAPNPVRTHATVRFAVPEPAAVHLAAYDLQGRRVATLLDGSLAAGHHTVAWDPAPRALSAGVYALRLTVETNGKPTHHTVLSVYAP